MPARYFLDTNVLVYSFDAEAVEKQRVAKELIAEALATQRGVISSQVVQEFLNVALRKFAEPMSPSEGRVYLDSVLAPLCEVFPAIDLYREALRVVEDTGYAPYDALIVASAIQAGCSTLYSEDLRDRHVVGPTTIRNPFVTTPTGG
jgi:predicted nucleic acid-binding protein